MRFAFLSKSLLIPLVTVFENELEIRKSLQDVSIIALEVKIMRATHFARPVGDQLAKSRLFVSCFGQCGRKTRVDTWLADEGLRGLHIQMESMIPW